MPAIWAEWAVMQRIALALFISTVFAGHIFSLDRTLIAEGDYAAERESGSTILAHWTLWGLSNREYEVIETSAKNAHLIQTFRFDAKFMPIGYALRISPLSKPEVERNPEAAKLSRPMSVSCEYTIQELKCLTKYDGHKSTASIAAKYPYVFFPGEFYAMDFTWFLTGVVHLLEQTGVQGNPVNVYLMEDSPTNFRQGEIVLKPDQPIRLFFTGEEASTVMGKTQEIRKYEGWGTSELSVLRVTLKGLVALTSGKQTPNVGFGITNLVEHEPWPLPFHTALRATRLPEPPGNLAQVSPTPGRIQRARVPSGIMAGLVLRKVQPVYPDSAKEKRIEGQVVLSAVIGSDGHVLELEPLSGPAELIPAAISAVQQWRYRPYAPSGQPSEVETEIQVNFTLLH